MNCYVSFSGLIYDNIAHISIGLICTIIIVSADASDFNFQTVIYIAFLLVCFSIYNFIYSLTCLSKNESINKPTDQLTNQSIYLTIYISFIYLM